MDKNCNVNRRGVLRAIALSMLLPATLVMGQPPVVTIESDFIADNEALYVAKNVLCFVRGKKATQGVEVTEIQHTDAGSNRASVVRLRYVHKRSRVNCVITMEMIKKPGLRRIYQLTFRDDRSPLNFPEHLLEVREQINSVFARGDLLSRLTPRRLPFESLPLVDESAP